MYVKYYEKIIEILQSLAFAKLDNLLLSIKIFFKQRDLTFTHALLIFANTQQQTKNQCSTWYTLIVSDNECFRSGKS